MNHITSIRLGLVASVAFTLACQSKGPAPGQELSESADVIMADREGPPSGAQSLGMPTQDIKRDYARTPHDPHGPAAHLNTPDSHVSGEVRRVNVGGLSFVAPKGWTYQHPAAAMRRAELGVRGENGTAGLVVYFFGNQGAGSAQANIERWVGQFQNVDGTPVTTAKPSVRELGGMKVTQVEVAGTYVGGMGSGVPEGRARQRMIASIVETPKGPYYFKFLGDDAAVKDNRAALDALLASMQPVDG